MKRLIAALCIVCIFTITTIGCGDNMVIKGKEIETVGLVNMALNDASLLAIKDPQVKYQVIWGNVIWGALLFGTVIAPIYFYGFSMFEPVGSI